MIYICMYDYGRYGVKSLSINSVAVETKVENGGRANIDGEER